MNPNLLNISQKERMQNLRLSILLKSPFWGHLLSYTPFRESKEIPTFATNGQEILFNPDFSATLTDPEVRGVILHEIMHIVFMHPLRIKFQKNIDRYLWNIAGDMIINREIDNLDNQKFWCLPKDKVVCPKEWEHFTTEQIYKELLQKPKSYSPFDELLPSKSDKPQTQQEDEITIRVSSAIEHATDKNQGNIPGSIRRNLAVIHETRNRPTWDEYFLQIITKALGDSEYSFRNPCKTFLQVDRIFPRPISKSCGEIAIVIDTSGSISEKDLSKYIGEFLFIISRYRPELVHLLYCDAAIQGVESHPWQGFDVDQLSKHAPGGGGTSFLPPFEYLTKEGINPLILVYFTDTEGDFPPIAPDYPVVWVSNNSYAQVPWGDLLIIEKD
jgi:predicted metal-dependent peptidase